MLLISHEGWRSAQQATYPPPSVFQADGEVTLLRHDEAASSESTGNDPLAEIDAERPLRYIRESEYWLGQRKDPNIREGFANGGMVPGNDTLARQSWISRGMLPLPTTSEKGTQTDDLSRPSSRGSFHGVSLVENQDHRPDPAKEIHRNFKPSPTQGSRQNGHPQKEEPACRGSPKAMQAARKTRKRSRSDDAEEPQDIPRQQEVDGPAKARKHKQDTTAYRYCSTTKTTEFKEHAKTKD
jgi:hypothetical protein